MKNSHSLILDDFKRVFFDDFETLSLRSGGPTQVGFASGSGRWTPGFFFDDEPRGQTFWDTGEIAFKINPGFDWRDYPHATGQLSVSESLLRIRAEITPQALLEQLPTNPNTGRAPSWISGVLTSRHSFSIGSPAYYEIRAKLPKGKGLWPAFWLVASNNPAQREIDVLEFHGDKPDWTNVAQHNANYIGANLESEAQFCGRGVDFTLEFHTFGCLRTDERLIFYIDGFEICKMRPSIMLEEVLLYPIIDLSVGGRWPGYPNSDTPSPSYFYVDWVSIWAPSETQIRTSL